MQLYQERTKSVNHQFQLLDLEPILRYCKTTVHMVSGKRLNPDPDAPYSDRELEYLLRSLDDETRLEWTFRYADDVIELYSERDVRNFKMWNAEHIRNGTLIEWD